MLHSSKFWWLWQEPVVGWQWWLWKWLTKEIKMAIEYGYTYNRKHINKKVDVFWDTVYIASKTLFVSALTKMASERSSVSQLKQWGPRSYKDLEGFLAAWCIALVRMKQNRQLAKCFVDIITANSISSKNARLFTAEWLKSEAIIKIMSTMFNTRWELQFQFQFYYSSVLQF